MEFRATLTGTESVLRALELLPAGLRLYAYEDGLFEAAKVHRAAARHTRLFKDKTGTLRKSLRARRGLARYRPSALVTSSAPHAHLIEFGTRHSAARPFFMQTVLQNRSQMFQRFAFGCRRNFRRVERQLTGQTRLTRRTLASLAGNQSVTRARGVRRQFRSLFR